MCSSFLDTLSPRQNVTAPYTRWSTIWLLLPRKFLPHKEIQHNPKIGLQPLSSSIAAVILGRNRILGNVIRLLLLFWYPRCFCYLRKSYPLLSDTLALQNPFMKVSTLPECTGSLHLFSCTTIFSLIFNFWTPARQYNILIDNHSVSNVLTHHPWCVLTLIREYFLFLWILSLAGSSYHHVHSFTSPFRLRRSSFLRPLF